jgi:hypothetical protein
MSRHAVFNGEYLMTSTKVVVACVNALFQTAPVQYK